MAWWYRHYAPSSRDLPKLQDQARRAKIGLWSQPNPITPWGFRKGGSTPAAIAQAPNPAQAPAQPANVDSVYVTAKGKAYHTATCGDLTNSKTKHPIPRSEAISRGYRPCKTCKPDTGTGQAVGRQGQAKTDKMPDKCPKVSQHFKTSLGRSIRRVLMG